MKKKHLQKFTAYGCILALSCGLCPGYMFPLTTVAAESTQTETAGITHAYQATAPGQTLKYDLNGYTEDDISVSKWYRGDTLIKLTSGVSDYDVTTIDEESFVSYEVHTNDGNIYTGTFYCSTLPVLYIDSEADYSSFQVKTEDYTSVSMHLTGKGYTNDMLYDGDAGIRLRGNSTAGLAKKPFKVKLDSKSDLLGMGKQKHWVLLANAIDNTNIRNKLMYDFSGAIGAENYMQSENVSLIYNGEYMGVYQLCEQVRVGSNRVDIFNWEDVAEDVADLFLKELQAEGYLTKNQRKEISSAVEDELNANYNWIEEPHSFTSATLKGINSAFAGIIDLSDYVDFDELDLPDPTGGALIEMDFYTGASADLLTAYQQPFYFDTPEYGRTYTALSNYLKEYIQTVEYALHDTDFIYNNSDKHYMTTNLGTYDWRLGKRTGVQYALNNSFTSSYEGTHYSELLDMDAAVVNFLICEFSRNWDSMKNSLFMYKDIDGKLILGPSWDFDWAFGNSMYGIDTNYPLGWQTTDEYFANEQYYQTVQWNRSLIRDPYFLERVYEKYLEIRPTVIEDIIKEGGLLDTYYQKYYNSSIANDRKWGGNLGSHQGSSYTDEFNYLRNFIQLRVDWLDEQFASLETFRQSTGYYVTSTDISIDKIESDTAGYTQIQASCTKSGATAVSFQVNGTYMASANLVNGIATIRIPDSALTAKKGESNVVQVRALNASGQYITRNTGTVYGDYQNSVSNYAIFDKKFSLTLTETETPTYSLTTHAEYTSLDDVTVSSTIAEICDAFVTDDIRITDADGTLITDKNAKVATGWKVQRVIGDTVSDEAVIVIKGEVNGDGKIDVLDMEDVQKSLLRISNLSDVSSYAAISTTGLDYLSVNAMEWIQKYILHIPLD